VASGQMAKGEEVSGVGNLVSDEYHRHALCNLDRAIDYMSATGYVSRSSTVAPSRGSQRPP